MSKVERTPQEEIEFLEQKDKIFAKATELLDTDYSKLTVEQRESISADLINWYINGETLEYEAPNQ